uniref:Uncharacterized protein n=1 Tax=Dunaliella tertiolecta TaxID=3047 RepID=A0A7S3R1D0_DUNTE
MHAQMGLLVTRAQEAEAARAELAEHLQQQQQQPQGPTPAQQEMLARMAQRLEALEAGHRRAVERLHEERDEARAAVEALQMQVESERQQAAVAVEEVDLCAKAKEAELNARMLSLESQIHWLGEQNTQLQAELVKASSAGGDKENSGSSTAADAEQVVELSHKCAALEADLRRAKRAEMKLQALLFRMRSDIEKAGGSCVSFDNLRDVRSLEYDVDMLTQKLKRTERLLQQQQQQQLQQQGTTVGCGTPSKGGSKAGGPLANKAADPLADKENMVQQRGLIGGHPNVNPRW